MGWYRALGWARSLSPKLVTSLGHGNSAPPGLSQTSACFTPMPPSSERPSSPDPTPQVRSQALLFIKRMYEKEQLREYVEKFALNYLQLLVHPNPPSVLFGADKDTGLAQVLQRCSELGDGPLGETARQQELERAQVAKAGACGKPERVPGPA